MTSPADYPWDLAADVLMRDGRPCHLRPIRPDDAAALVEFHESLSPETIYYRFFAPYPHLSERDIERFTTVDYDDRLAFVATQLGRIVGVGRYDRVDDHSAEVAFTIRDDHQGRGLGSVLLEHLAAAARERGIDRFVAEVLPVNARMIGTFTEAGYKVKQRFEDGVVSLEFDIEPTEHESAVMLAREHAAEARSVVGLLYPKKVAIIGVSRREQSIGQLVVRNLLAGEFTGSLYAVHPEVDEIAGIPAYRSVAAAPGPIDLAVVTAPIESVTAIVDDCAEAGVRAMLVISSGFTELDPHGTERVRELVTRAHEAGMRVIGPEAFGLINTDPRVHLNASLADIVPRRGRLGFFCESGTLGATFLEEMAQRHLGLSTFVSPGMRVDLSSNDLLQYWEGDDATSVVLLYLQGLGNPRKFARIARRLSRRKPVLAVLSGRVVVGPDGEPTRPDTVVDDLLAQCGILQTQTIGGLLDAAALMAMQPAPRGSRVALVSNSTALLMHTMDLVDSSGMRTVQRPYRVPWDAHSEDVRRVLSDALDAPDVDAVIVIHVPPVRSDLGPVAEVLRDVAAASSKPVLAVLPHETGLTGRSSLVVSPDAFGMPGAGSVPVYGEPAAAVAALGLAVRHAAWLATPVGEEREALGIDHTRAAAVIEPRVGTSDGSERAVGDSAPDETAPLPVVPGDGPLRLSQESTIELLSAYGLEVWPSVPVTTEEDAVRAAAEIGYPVVLKTVDSRLVHRADLGGVRLALENERALRTAYLSMVAQLDDLDGGLVLQAMAPPGVPCAVVTREDPSFGPIMAFAIGGHVSDLVEDWAYWMPPLTDVDAQKLVRAPRTSPLLFGYQGTDAANIDSLTAVLMRVANLAGDWPQIASLELNPVLATPSGCYILGATVELAPARDRQEWRPRRM